MLPGKIARASRPTWAGSPEAKAAERIARPIPLPPAVSPVIVTAPTRRAPKAPKVRKPAAGPAGFVAACQAAGATLFCPTCYAYVLPAAHVCPDWAAFRVEFHLPKFSAPAAVVTLAGGLETQDPDDGAPEREES